MNAREQANRLMKIAVPVVVAAVAADQMAMLRHAQMRLGEPTDQDELIRTVFQQAGESKAAAVEVMAADVVAVVVADAMTAAEDAGMKAVRRAGAEIPAVDVITDLLAEAGPFSHRPKS